MLYEYNKNWSIVTAMEPDEAMLILGSDLKVS